ncbi:MAG: acetate kinase [Myxococcota bacterium]
MTGKPASSEARTGSMRVLALNCGSSSLKFALLETASGDRLLEGREELGEGAHAAALDSLLARLDAAPELLGGIEAVGHRVVHGGEAFSAPVRIDAEVVAGIQAVSPLAPLHNPANLLGIERLRAALPALPQVAVFDTAFHQTLPARAHLYALPRFLHRDHGVRRYGFHGTSHRYVAAEAVRRLDLDESCSRVISAHLGNGCSLAAVLGGRCVDTSMGLSPLEGLVMGTRSGDVDPGLHLFLSQRLGFDLPRVTALLNEESGLLGISELSGDVRELEAAERGGHAGARLALEIFCYRLARYVAALTVPLAGLDALVFTGGVGENSARVRAGVLEALAYLGFALDPTRNCNHGASSEGLVVAGGPPFALVVPTDEESLIALETARVLEASP